MSDNIVTAYLSEFGALERSKLVDIFEAWEKYGLPTDFSESEVVAMFNKNSGKVFLSNEDYEVAVLENGALVSFYVLPSGLEGTFTELYHDSTIEEWNSWDDEDRSYVNNLLVNMRAAFELRSN